MKPDTIATGKFDQADDLLIRRAPNGGFALFSSPMGRGGYEPQLIGAYSNKDDLISALSSVL